MKPITVEISSISRELPFRYHIDSDLSLLDKSIKGKGILVPVSLIKEKQYLIIDGYRRVGLARKFGFNCVPAYIYSEKELPDIFISTVHINLTQQDLSPVEKLMVCWIARQNFSTKIYQTALDYLQLSFIPGSADLEHFVCKSPEWLRNYLHRAGFSMKQLNRLIHYSLSDYYSWYTAADSLNLNGSELLKALEEVMDISLRDNISPENIAEILDIGRLVAGQLSSHQKSNRFKKRIEILRYPILNQINQKIVEYLKNFSDEFREIFRVDWDRSLEEPGISFQFRIKDAEDIQKNNNMLMKPEIQQQIMNLMNVIKNIPEQ